MGSIQLGIRDEVWRLGNGGWLRSINVLGMGRVVYCLVLGCTDWLMSHERLWLGGKRLLLGRKRLLLRDKRLWVGWERF